MGFGLKDKTSLAYQKDESKSFRYKENALVLGLVGITVLSGTILAIPSVLADDGAVTDVAITVPVACSITSTPDSAHTASVDSGTYKDNIGKTTIKATCNDSQGFSIYAIGYTNEEYGNTTLKPSVLDATQNSIITGTATSGATSSWAMKLTAGTGMTSTNILSDADGAYSNYHKVPTAYAKVATMASVTDATVGASLETTYAAYIAGDQPADIYTGKVKYTMVHPANEQPLQPQTSGSGKICYYANASVYEGTMGCQNVASSVTLLASNFSRGGYGFAGWSDKFDYATNANAKFYGPNETITIPDTSIYIGEGKGLSLYAVWVKSQGSIQDQSKVASVCNSLTTAPTDGTANLDSVTALTDQRDSNTYAIAKLADGKCWMIEDLRLEADNTRTPEKQALAQGYGTSTTYGNFGGLADAESTNFSNSTTANSLYYSGTQEGTASINIGASDFPAYRMPRYNNWNNQATSANRPQNPTTNSATNSTTNAGMYSYGNYYTWHAAIADLTYNGTDIQSTTGTSLCPAGWHLPKGGNKSNEANNELWSLVVDGINGGTKPANYDGEAYTYYTGTPEGSDASNKLRAYPNNFLYSGYFSSSSAYGRGSYGYYWSSTVDLVNNSYTLGLFSSNVYPGTILNSKYYGDSIRCVSSS